MEIRLEVLGQIMSVLNVLVLNTDHCLAWLVEPTDLTGVIFSVVATISQKDYSSHIVLMYPDRMP